MCYRTIPFASGEQIILPLRANWLYYHVPPAFLDRLARLLNTPLNCPFLGVFYYLLNLNSIRKNKFTSKFTML